MIPKITVQLYSLRERLQSDFEGTLRALAAMGYPCVEPAGFPGSTPSEAAMLFRELGLEAPSTHCELPLGDKTSEVIETALELGHKYLITGVPPMTLENFRSADTVKAMAELYCTAADNAAAHGLQIGYHNHDWDLAEVDGQPAYRLFLEQTPDTVLWEADLFWITRAGIDPVEFIREIGPRGRVLHFKDGKAHDSAAEFPFQPAGTGDVNLIAASKASGHAEYIAVELDEYDGDMLQAVQESYTYLTRSGIARGNK